MARQINIPIKTTGATKSAADLKKVDKATAGVATTTKAASGSFNLLGDSVKKAAIGFVALGGALVGLRVLKDVVANAAAAEAATAALGAVLKSTGGVAGVTEEAVLALSGKLQGLTSISDDVITEGQALLLTFTSISKDVFPDTIKTALDMSRAFGTDLKGSVIQLGKALNDPIKGISALSKVGVAFTDSQKDMIKVLQESGDIMGAQTIILDELKKEVGGAAEAYSKTLGGALDRVRLAVDDLSQRFGEVLGPSIIKTSEETILLLNSVERGVPTIVFWTKVIGGAAVAYGTLSLAMRVATFGLGKIGDFIFNLFAGTKAAAVAASGLASSWGKLTQSKLSQTLARQTGETGKAAAASILHKKNLGLTTQAMGSMGRAIVGLLPLIGVFSLAVFAIAKNAKRDAKNIKEYSDRVKELVSIRPNGIEVVVDELTKLQKLAKEDPKGLEAQLIGQLALQKVLKERTEQTGFLSNGIKVLTKDQKALNDLEHDILFTRGALLKQASDLQRASKKTVDANKAVVDSLKTLALAEDFESKELKDRLQLIADSLNREEKLQKDFLKFQGEQGALRIALAKRTQEVIFAEEEKGRALRKGGFARGLTELEKQLGALSVPPQLGEVMGEFAESIKNAREQTEALLGPLVSAFASTFTSELFPSLHGLKDRLVEAKDELKLLQDEGADNAGISRAAERVRELERELDKVSSFANRFENAWKGAFDAVFQAFTRLVAQMVAKAAILSILNLIPGFGAGIKTVDALGQIPKIFMAANGMNETVTKPTFIVAGEAGPEKVNITPLGQRNQSGGSGNTINLTINGGMVDEKFLRQDLMPAMARIELEGG